MIDGFILSPNVALESVVERPERRARAERVRLGVGVTLRRLAAARQHVDAHGGHVHELVHAAGRRRVAADEVAVGTIVEPLRDLPRWQFGQFGRFGGKGGPTIVEFYTHLCARCAATFDESRREAEWEARAS